VTWPLWGILPSRPGGLANQAAPVGEGEEMNQSGNETSLGLGNEIALE